ncbi:leucyl/phenylalanyl-tRNA--protein transferase [Nonlabens tegetincola]|uniref:leucyl/phenylalanyl-tRNA--protein transferase n=1 Tax=Nonlabens tegetincola TaxID=323273 RepID=UPI0030C8693D
MYILQNELYFPPVNQAPDHGLLAVGGDLKVDRLLLAYNNGIFPWYNDGEPICWWSPDPRMIFDLQSERPMRITKSLKQSRKNKGYFIKENTCFEKVMKACAQVSRPDQEGTWIMDEMIEAYSRLHQLGHAVSVEVFKNGELIGGLYGIDLPEKKVFCGESMFALQPDASKIALWHLVEKLQLKEYKIIDAQIYNDHLASLGAVEIPRESFIELLNI